jgi:Mlc titration factor MtfA (ptsG expression regulator)
MARRASAVHNSKSAWFVPRPGAQADGTRGRRPGYCYNWAENVADSTRVRGRRVVDHKFVILEVMLFRLIRRQRRLRMLGKPMPTEWQPYIERGVPDYDTLSAAARERLANFVRWFVAEKHWEGCGGLELTDEIRVTIAAGACLLVLELDFEMLNQVKSVLVYPTEYVDQRKSVILPGMLEVEEDEDDPESQGSTRLGEAWYRGPVILSWRDVERTAKLHRRDLELARERRSDVPPANVAPELASAPRQKRKRGSGRHSQRANVVAHEFAHQLDMLDRSVDGTPPLADKHQYATWTRVMTAEFQRLNDDFDRGRPTFLDPYAATNPAEFFAVATETFFEQPQAFATEHAELYGVLRDFYRQDPAARLTAPAEARSI